MADNDEQLEIEDRPQSRRERSGWLRSVVLPLMLVAAIVGGLLDFQAREDGGENDGFGIVALPEDKNATSRSPAAEEGRAAPDFLLTTLDGGTLRLSDLQGKPLLVNFFASWCVTCRAEMPDLVQAYEQYKSQGLIVIGVNLQEAGNQIQPFVQRFGMTFPVVLDRQGQVANAWRIGGPSSGLPSSYFIDSSGVVRKVVFGQLLPKDIESGLGLVLPKRS